MHDEKSLRQLTVRYMLTVLLTHYLCFVDGDNAIPTSTPCERLWVSEQQ